PTHMIGGYAQQSYGFNYYGTIGTNRDEFVIVRKMAKVDWLDRPAAEAGRGLWASLSTQVPDVVHALVQDADNLNAPIRPPVEYHVRPRLIPVIASAFYRYRTRTGWVERHALHTLAQRCEISVGLLPSPTLGAIVPNFVKIGFGAARKDIARHVFSALSRSRT